MNISIVIPNFNGEHLLRKNLPVVYEALEYYTNGNKELIIVDDASQDDSIAFIESQFSLSLFKNTKLKLVKQEKNLGFSSAINRGVKEASGDIVVLINSDVIPEKKFLPPLLSPFKNDKVFAVGCMDKSVGDNDSIVLRGRGVGKWDRGFLMHKRGEVDKKNTLWVNGGSGAFRKRLWEKLGGFDKLYNPFYWEDIDLGYRALKSGYLMYFEKESVVIHEHEKGAIKKHYSSSKIISTAYRNQFIFVWKNITDLNLMLSHFLWIPFHIITSFMRRDWYFFHGFIQALILIPSIIQSRDKQKKIFIKRDCDVLKEFSE